MCCDLTFVSSRTLALVGLGVVGADVAVLVRGDIFTLVTTVLTLASALIWAFVFAALVGSGLDALVGFGVLVDLATVVRIFA